MKHDGTTVIVGAGPYGLSVAAYLKARDIPILIFGKPMEFWHNMPEGMLLRSGVDWQLDPFEVHTFRAYLQERGLFGHDVKPIPVKRFIDYGDEKHYAYELVVPVGRNSGMRGQSLWSLDLQEVSVSKAEGILPYVSTDHRIAAVGCPTWRASHSGCARPTAHSSAQTPTCGRSMD